jgi:hypothetical protein
MRDSRLESAAASETSTCIGNANGYKLDGFECVCDFVRYAVTDSDVFHRRRQAGVQIEFGSQS